MSVCFIHNILILDVLTVCMGRQNLSLDLHLGLRQECTCIPYWSLARYVHALHEEIDFSLPALAEQKISEKIRSFTYELSCQNKDKEHLRKDFYTSVVLFDFMNTLAVMHFPDERERFESVMQSEPYCLADPFLIMMSTEPSGSGNLFHRLSHINELYSYREQGVKGFSRDLLYRCGVRYSSARDTLMHAREGLDMSTTLLNYVMFGFVVPRMLGEDRRVIRKRSDEYASGIVDRHGDCYIEVPAILEE